ncbi:MAG TPA: hypothetical protein VNW93_11590 [Mycobacterium sp.]|nr:hypothetical protein [Mycobacterium sp.]
MKNTAFAAALKWTAFARQLIVAAALAGAVIVAMLVGAGTASANRTPGTPHTGPDYVSITGARVGAPSEQEVSNYGGSHKHLFVEQQLYGPGVVAVPRVDTTVRQSR